MTNEQKRRRFHYRENDPVVARMLAIGWDDEELAAFVSGRGSSINKRPAFIDKLFASAYAPANRQARLNDAADAAIVRGEPVLILTGHGDTLHGVLRCGNKAVDLAPTRAAIAGALASGPFDTFELAVEAEERFGVTIHAMSRLRFGEGAREDVLTAVRQLLTELRGKLGDVGLEALLGPGKPGEGRQFAERVHVHHAKRASPRSR